jgi:hypothetical protein
VFRLGWTNRVAFARGLRVLLIQDEHPSGRLEPPDEELPALLTHDGSDFRPIRRIERDLGRRSDGEWVA